MNSDRTGFYAFLGASAVAALLAVISVLNPFGASPSSDIETSAEKLAAVPPSTPVAFATPHPTAALITPTPTPTPKAKPKPKPTKTQTAASTSAGSTATKKPATQAAPRQVANTNTNSANANNTNTANNSGSDTNAEATATPAPSDETSGGENTGGENTGGENTGNEDTGQAPTATTGSGTTGSVGGPTSSNGSRALSAAEASTYVAHANFQGRVSVFDGPNGQEIQTVYQDLYGNYSDYPITSPTAFGNRLALRVVSGSPGDEWLQVALPIRPNGQTGWVRGSDFEIGGSAWYIEVNVSNNSVSVWNGEELVVETAAVTGSSSTPTPISSGFVEEIINGPSAAYGPKLLSLGMFSNSHNDFGGGVPKIALHGTNQPELMGQYASNGCVRIPNEIISQLANMVPIGTRVQIVG